MYGFAGGVHDDEKVRKIDFEWWALGFSGNCEHGMCPVMLRSVWIRMGVDPSRLVADIEVLYPL